MIEQLMVSIFMEFAQSIGYDSGDIVSMWINGSSTSYNGKLHEISAKYGVSVAWLMGETGEKSRPKTGRDKGIYDKRIIYTIW